MPEGQDPDTAGSTVEKPRVAPSLKDLTTVLQVGSVVLVLLLLLKAYGVARYSVVTGGELVTGAPVAIALGTLALYEPAVYPVVSACLFWWLCRSRNRSLVHGKTAARLACVISAALAPVFYLVIVYAAAGAFFGLFLLANRYRDWRPSTAGRFRSLAALLAALADLAGGFARRPLTYFVAFAITTFVLATLETPWVPAEVLVTRSSILVNPKLNERDSTPVVFVLNESGDNIFVLAAQSRAVIRVPTSNVAGRIVCFQPGLGLGGRPLFDFVLRRESTTPYLKCSTLQRELRDGSITN